jgi:hypothetical protein
MEESNLIRNWIYSYLKYGGVVTQEQRDRSKKAFKKYLEENREAIANQRKARVEAR